MKKKEYIITITIFLLFQAIMYWFVKLFQIDYNYINFYLDNKIPFIGYFIYVYNLFYPCAVIMLYYLFKKDKNNYYLAIISGTIGFLISDLIFIIYPTTIIRGDINNYYGLTRFLLNITYKLDTPAINCFPSIHCLFAFVIMFGYIFSNKIKTNNKLIVLFIQIMIILSTIFVKQHYIFDIVGALIVYFISYLITIKLGLSEKIRKYVTKKVGDEL